MGVGAAARGLRPVCDLMFFDFIGVALDQLYNQAAKLKFMFGGDVSVPLTLTTAGGAGLSAGPQHSQSLEAWLAHVPGLKVALPSSPYDVKGLMVAAVRDDNPTVRRAEQADARHQGPGARGDLRDTAGPGQYRSAPAATRRSSRSAAWCPRR